MDLDAFNVDSTPPLRPLDPALRLEAVPFQPDGGCSPFGMILVFALSGAAALGLAYLVSWIDDQFDIYVILLFPFLVGLGLGFVGAIGVYMGNVRNTFLAGLAGLFSGLLAMAAMHYLNYQHFLKQPPQAQGNPPKKGAVAPPPPRDLFEYLDRKAGAGIQVHFRRLNLNLGYIGTLVYWIAEVLIAGGMAVVIMCACAADPFCTQCHNWKDKRSLGTLTMAPETATHIFTSGEIVRLADQDFPPGEGKIQLTAWVCKSCGAEAPVDVKLDQVSTNSKDEEETKQIAYVTYPGQALPVLESLFPPAEPVPEKAEVQEEVEE
jgi:hypothetical protein